MARCLKLTRLELSEVNYFYLGAFRLRIEASDPRNTGTDPNIFLYRRNPANPYNGEVVDSFFAMTGPLELSDYPVGEPNPSSTYPFFRLDYIEVDLPSTAVANELWLTILREADQLLKALDRLEQLEVSQEVFIGTCPAVPVTPPGPSSESSASSESLALPGPFAPSESSASSSHSESSASSESV